MILVTGASGMFGGRVLKELISRQAPVRALTHSPEKAQPLQLLGAEPVIGNLDEPASVQLALRGIERVFLVSPMDSRIGEREVNLIHAASKSGVQQIVKLYGAVRHRTDQLDQLHQASIAALRSSGIAFTLISPNTVMESNLFAQAETVKNMNTMFAAAGEGRIGFVAAADCARAAAVVLTQDLTLHCGQNYEITGPEALTYGDVAQRMSHVLGRTITYQDLTPEAFGELLINEAGFQRDTIEIDVLCHFRAFRRGDADLVTDTFERLTGEAPTSIESFIAQHRQHFE